MVLPYPGIPKNLLKFVGPVVNLNIMPLLKHYHELKFVDNILSESCILYKRPFLLQSDSEPAMAIAKIPCVNQRTKQIEAFDHYTRKALQDGLIELDYMPTKDNLAKIFTKPLGLNVFTPHQNNFICSCCSVN